MARIKLSITRSVSSNKVIKSAIASWHEVVAVHYDTWNMAVKAEVTKWLSIFFIESASDIRAYLAELKLKLNTDMLFDFSCTLS